MWVSDLKRYYSEAYRILRKGGTLMVSEYHPFRRIWRKSADRLDLEYGYFERGPHQYDRSEDVQARRQAHCPALSSIGQWQTTLPRS